VLRIGTPSRRREDDSRSDAPVRGARGTHCVSAAGVAAGIVDPDRIESLRRIANRDRTFLQRYTAATLDDLDAAVAELGRAVADGNLKGARDALHKIDGTSASIGAMALAASAKSMRNYLSSSPDPDTAAALAELVSTSALTKSAVTALLQDGRISHRDSR
jgi:HPt (histidine-containing phosphotransfer) domain-containing protein